MLDYEYIKNHYRVIAVNLRRQKELDADPKEVQEIEFTGRFKNTDGINSDGTQFIFFFKTLEKNKKSTTKVFSRKRNSLIKDGKL